MVAYYNSGSLGWTQGKLGEAAYLGTWDPTPGQDNPSKIGGDGTNGSPNTGWPRFNRIAQQPAPYVAPGQVAWFTFTVQAPQMPGVYKLYLRPLVEGATWMEDYGVFWVVTVLNPDGTAPAPTVGRGFAPGVYTIAGSGPADVGDGRRATDARLKEPSGLHAARDGSVYIADTGHNRVRQVMPDGTIRTVAGYGSAENLNPRDGVPATESPLRLPRGVAVGLDGAVYIADSNYYLVRRVEAASGIIRTVAGNRRFFPDGDGGPALSASFGFPSAVAVDGAGGIYVADSNSHRIRYIDPAGIITTVIGSRIQGPDALTAPRPGCTGLPGTAATAATPGPTSIALDGKGGLLIGGGSCPVARLLLAEGTVTAVSSAPSPVASSGSGDAYVFAGGGLRRVDVETGVTTEMGTFPDLQAATSLSVGPGGVVYVADAGRNVVWKATATGGLTRFAGAAVPESATVIGDSQGVAVDVVGNVYFSDFASHRIMRLAPDGTVSSIAGTGRSGLANLDGHPLRASFSNPTALRFDALGGLFFIDETEGNGVVLRISPGADSVIDGSSDERITAVAGRLRPRSEADRGAADGSPATSAVFVGVRDIVFDRLGNLYLADFLDHRVRKVIPGADGILTGAPDEIISTFAGDGVEAHRGDGGPATTASVYQPYRLAVDSAGNVLIAENSGGRNIRRVDARTGVIDPAPDLPGMGSGQMMFGPEDRLYYSDRLRIIRVDLSTGTKTVVAGSGFAGFNGDQADPLKADFRGIGFFTFDSTGAIVAADNGNSRLVRIVLTR